MSDPEFARAFNAALSTIVIVMALAALWFSTRAASVEVAAQKYAARIGLPFGSDVVHTAVVGRMRTIAKIDAAAPLLAGAVSLAFVATPLGSDPLYVFFVLLPSSLTAMTIATFIESVGERLFHPAPDSPRVARLSTMGLSDYLGPARRRLPLILLVGAAIALGMLAVAVAGGAADPRSGFVAAAIVAALVAAAALVVIPQIERKVLEQPQPASHSLELAWDDAFRLRALSSLRQTLAVAASFVIGLSIAAIASGSNLWWAQQLPLWGLVALQLVYAPSRLPVGLQPPWLATLPLDEETQRA